MFLTIMFWWVFFKKRTHGELEKKDVTVAENHFECWFVS